MLLDTLGTRLLGNKVAGKGVTRAGEETSTEEQELSCHLIL